MVIGTIFDILGRRIPLVIGIIFIAISMGCIPLGKTIYPGFLLLYILNDFGTTIGMNVPLLPDYVQKDNIGRAQGILHIMVSLSWILATTGLF